jgi:hypothetical protein
VLAVRLVAKERDPRMGAGVFDVLPADRPDVTLDLLDQLEVVLG